MVGRIIQPSMAKIANIVVSLELNALDRYNANQAIDEAKQEEKSALQVSTLCSNSAFAVYICSVAEVKLVIRKVNCILAALS